MAWQDIVRSLAHRAERGIDRRRRPRTGVPAILPYRGFGRSGELMIRGRVLIEKRITRAGEAEPVWRNVLNAYRRFHSAEVAGAKVRVSYRDAVVETISDDEGYFNARLKSDLIGGDALWHEVGLILAGGEAPVKGEAIVPPPDAKFGIISDIDDTIVRTGATSLKQMIRNTLLHSAATRLPFEGVADLYRALHAGRNPIFYVSSGPWNLYDLLAEYMELNGIPHGPIFLQDWGIDEESLIMRSHDLHKQREIQALIDYYDDLPFILIGDSGQRDPEIYVQTMQVNRGRIPLAIIRDVTDDRRDQAVTVIAGEAASARSEMVYVPDSATAFDHLRRLRIL